MKKKKKKTLRHLNFSFSNLASSTTFITQTQVLPTLIIYVFENIVGKEENAGYQHFLIFLQCFQTMSLLRMVKTRDCVGRIEKPHGYTHISADARFNEERLHIVYNMLTVFYIKPLHCL